MSNVSNVSPANGAQTPKPETGKLKKLMRLAVLGLLGTGVIGNGAVTYINHQNQTEHTARLNGELSESRNIIDELNRLLQHEQSTNQHQARQMIGLNRDLEQGQATINRLNQTIRQDQVAIQNLTRQLTDLNHQLGTRITLDQIITAASMVTPSTVRVEGARGLGSGVILMGEHGQRYILTNGHVTQHNELTRNEFQDGVYHIKIYNGSDTKNPIEFDAAPVMLANGQRAYSSPGEHDLALLAIPPNIELPPNLGVRFRDITANPLRVGEPVIAVGNPFGERDSVTIGSISHIDRTAHGLNINQHIQTDAPINPGNSGGGLFSVRVVDGKPVVELVGINTWGYRGGDGVGGSIRIDYIQQVLRGWGIKLS